MRHRQTKAAKAPVKKLDVEPVQEKLGGEGAHDCDHGSSEATATMTLAMQQQLMLKFSEMEKQAANEPPAPETEESEREIELPPPRVILYKSMHSNQLNSAKMHQKLL